MMREKRQAASAQKTWRVHRKESNCARVPDFAPKRVSRRVGRFGANFSRAERTFPRITSGDRSLLRQIAKSGFAKEMHRRPRQASRQNFAPIGFRLLARGQNNRGEGIGSGQRDVPQSEFDDSPDATGAQMIVDHDKVAINRSGRRQAHETSRFLGLLNWIGQRIIGFHGGFLSGRIDGHLASAGQTQPGTSRTRAT